MEQLHTFGNPDRDPRTRVITVAYLALVPKSGIAPRGGDDATEAAWHPAINPPQLAFDHDEILKVALDRLRDIACNTTIPFCLLPELFTLQELQTVYELLLGCQLDKRNFRRRMRAMAKLIRLDKKHPCPRGRPAILYRMADVGSW